MIPFASRMRSLSLFTGSALLAVVAGSASAVIPTPMNLQRAPLFLNSSVDPNVLVTLDDSGSMAWPFLPDTAEGGCNYRHPRHFSHVFNRLYYNPAVVYAPPLSANGTPFPNADFNAAWLDGYESPPSPKTGKVATPVINLATSYFPKRNTQLANSTTSLYVGHEPRLRPLAPDLNAVTNIGTTDVWYNNCTNPTNASTPTPVPLIPPPPPGRVAIASTNAWLPFTSANNQTTGVFFTGTTGGTSAAFYYQFTGDPNIPAQVNNPRLYAAVNVATQPAGVRQNFANWFSYYSNRYLLARTAMTRSFGVQDSGLRVAYQQINALGFNPGTTTLNKFEGAARTAFFQRIYSLPTGGGTPNRNAMYRAGSLFAYGSSAITDNRNPYWEGAPLSRELTCRQNFHVHVTDGYSNGGDPSPAPVPFGWANLTAGLTLPDGKVYAPAAPVSRIFGNIRTPTNAGGCYDGVNCRASKATIAFTYWANDLRPDLTNNVPAFFGDRTTGITGAVVPPPIADPANVPEIYWNPDNDPATWQRMVNFTVGLGVGGTRTWPTSYTALRAGALNWPGFRSNFQETIDDFWHAGLVSRGGFFSASNPQELVDSLSSALTSVVARRGTASAATVTSGIIQASTLAFRTGFDSGDWTGQVYAYTVGSDGRVVEPAAWEAGSVLTGRDPNSRVIITSANATGDGVPFRWASVPATYRESLSDNPATSVIDDDTLGEQRLAYIRGDRSEEINNGGSFRIRGSLLGAVVNSGAVVVAAPAAAFTDEDFPGGPEETAAVKYAAFRALNKNRDRVIYVGANDGMLHAFDAGTGVTGFDGLGNPIVDFGTGEEKWAFVPREVVPNLSRLTNSTFEFTPYVDNSPVVRDVFVGGRWRTLLVGSLRRGGQGIFALDITNPNITEGDANNVVLWEFSDDVAGGERMGFTYGRPNISRLANGKWVIVVPASYNSEQNTPSEPQVAPPDPAAPSGGSTLFVLDAANGAVLRQFNFTPAQSRGMTTPTMGDYESDFIDDFAVAGDLQGNLWRFNLSNPNPAAWSVERMFRPATDFEQPITSAPRLFPDAKTGGIIVVVGTGKYLEPGDRSVVGTFTQSLYGIRDYNAGSANYPILRAQLVSQTLTKTPGIPPAPSTFRVTNNNITDANRGWRIDLVDAGERAVTSAGALFSQGIGIFSTIIPNGDDPCLPGLRGNVFVLNAASGAAPSVDRDGDGVITAADANAAVGQSVAQSVAEGSPALLVNVGGGLGTLIDFPEINVPTTIWRRRSWRELTPDD